MRLGELLSTRHCDWHAGRGGTPFIEVIPRQDHPAGVRCKSSRYRRIYISDELERLHSEYVWELCDAGVIWKSTWPGISCWSTSAAAGGWHRCGRKPSTTRLRP